MAGAAAAAILVLTPPLNPLALLRRLLLLPLLSPLLAALLVAAMNPRPAVSLRLLTWRSPAMPLGAWIAAAAAAGAALSGSASALSLRQNALPLRRRQRRGVSSFEREIESWDSGFGGDTQGRGVKRPQPPTAVSRSSSGVDSAGPSRAAGEPAPTVSVPFRVIRRAPAAAAAPAGVGARVVADAWVATAPTPEPVPMGPEEDWSESVSDDW